MELALQLSINEISGSVLFTRPFLPLPFLIPPTRKGLGTKQASCTNIDFMIFAMLEATLTYRLMSGCTRLGINLCSTVATVKPDGNSTRLSFYGESGLRDHNFGRVNYATAVVTNLVLTYLAEPQSLVCSSV